MILRAFNAWATLDGAEAYQQFFTRSVLPELQDIDGYRGAYVIRREREGQVEIQVLTLWESLDAVRRFSGDDIDTAVVEPGAQAVLAGYDTTVTHHDVVVSPGA